MHENSQDGAKEIKRNLTIFFHIGDDDDDDDNDGNDGGDDELCRMI